MAEPPAPVHVSVNVLLAALNAPVLAVPESALLPDQAPLAVHAVALVDDQVSVELPPLTTLVGLAVSVTAGAGGAVTATVTDASSDPPAPEHDSE
ncbi:MAG TPA: hypothetical protein VE046_11290 [Steroidobacteraceae bacterium]|nr:hypothetical protein [Steroidobacteraceae bacterium]